MCMRQRKWRIICILFTLVIFWGMTGCEQSEKKKDKVLSVLTEVPYRDKVEDAAAYMMQTHPELKVKIEYISLEEEEREKQIEKLRTKIMAGEGADVYLLDSVKEDASATLAPLFENPYKTMQSGTFASLNHFMEEDIYIGKKGPIRKNF